MAQKKKFVLAMAPAILVCIVVGIFSAPTMESVNVIQLASGSAIDLFSAWSPDCTKITFRL